MALQSAISEKDLIILTIIAVFIINVASFSLEESGNKIENIKAVLNNTQTEKQQKTFKKELKVNLTALNLEPVTVPPESVEHTEKFVIIDEKSIIETAGKVVEQQTTERHKTPVELNVIEKSSQLTNTQLSATKVSGHHHEEEEFLIKVDDDISGSLKTGFYFFLIMSSGAIIYLTFRIYRLRLSRAERKYGVQGDRTTQELTPLPISIEDGHSDDEDQTLFEVQRQNIRIL